MGSAVVACVFALLVTGACSSGDNEPGSACDRAMADAARVDELQDTVTDVDAAIAACPTLADFVAASEKYPAALDGADPVTYIANRCADVATGALCDAVAP
jgi:hypothetical protein